MIEIIDHILVFNILPHTSLDVRYLVVPILNKIGGISYNQFPEVIWRFTLSCFVSI